MPLPPSYNEILLAQEAAEDQRLKARAQEIWQASQEFRVPTTMRRRRGSSIRSGRPYFGTGRWISLYSSDWRSTEQS
jgi:hypothetical protein